MSNLASLISSELKGSDADQKEKINKIHEKVTRFELDMMTKFGLDDGT